jgi:hypothetical protein
MATTNIFSFDKLISPNHIASRLIRYSSPAGNISAQSSDPRVVNKVKLFNRLVSFPFSSVNQRLEWSPSFGTYIYWTDDENYGGEDYTMNYDEFGNVDKASVVSVELENDSYLRFGQFSSIYGFNNYPNIQYLGIVYNKNLESLDLSNVNNLKEFEVYACNLSEGINFSNQSQLITLGVESTKINSITLSEQLNLEDINIESNFYLESVNIPGSGNIDGIMDIYYNPFLSSITAPLNTTYDLQWYNNALTNVNVSQSALLETLDVRGNFLTSLNFNGCPYLKFIYAQNNVFSTTTVDNLFKSASNAADTYSLNNGNINLSDSNGIPSDASLAARENLTSRGWDVYYAQYETLYFSEGATDPNVAAWTYTTASNGSGNGTYPAVYTEGQNTYATPNIKTLSVDGLSEIDGVFYMDGQSTTQQTLESVNFNNLPDMCSLNEGELYIQDCRKLTSINVTVCPSVTDAYLNYNERLISINLSGSTNITRLEVNYNFNLTDLDLSQLPNLEIFEGYNTFGITSYDFTNNPELTTIEVGSGGGGGQLFSNLESVDCSGLTHLTSLNVSSNSKLTSLNLSGSNILEEIYMYDGCGLTYIDLSTQTSLSLLEADNSSFSSIDIPLTNTLIYVDLYNNQLTSGAVNKVLHVLASGSATSGYVRLSGGYSQGDGIYNGDVDTTSGGYDGIAAKDELISRSWDVIYND